MSVTLFDTGLLSSFLDGKTAYTPYCCDPSRVCTSWGRVHNKYYSALLDIQNRWNIRTAMHNLIVMLYMNRR